MVATHNKQLIHYTMNPELTSIVMSYSYGEAAFSFSILTLIVLHKYTHVKPAVLPYLHVTAAAVLNRSVELDWN